MSGVEIEYLLGLFFLINAISWSGGTFIADAVRLIAGILLVALAIVGFSLTK